MGNEHPDENLTERARTLLKALVERYIVEGKPVGSRTLSRVPGLDLSPATIRNVMADLEEHGYIRAPHTSAGRVPTERGYRVFVDSLVQMHPISRSELANMERSLDPDQDTGGLLYATSSLLSELTRLVGVVTVPRRERIALRHIEFVPLSEKRVLAIVVTNDREVQNCIVRTDREFAGDELRHIANFLNAEFAGHDLDSVRARLLSELAQVRDDMHRLMGLAVEVAAKVFVPQHLSKEAADLVLSGQTNLMGFDELADLEKLRQLFQAFSEKREILHLLDRMTRADGIKIFIGQEAGSGPLVECSLVVSPYSVDGETVGVLGVIGPTRIPYDRIIPIVEVTARLLGAALDSRN